MTSSILSSPESRRLGQTLASMQREIDTLRAAQQSTQLGDSTLYGAIYIADPDGNVKGIVGEQADGSTGVVVTDGPAPPRPNTPSLTPLMSGVDVAWSGTFVAVKPLNFSHVNVYLSDAGPNFIEGPSNLVGTLSDAGSIPVAPLASGTQWWARLVAVNDSVPPKMSEPSLTVGPVTPDQVVAQDVLDGIVTEVKLANDAVTAAKIAAGAVGTGEIAGQAVTLSQLASGSVDATKLTSGAVTQPAIAANAVTANALAANSVIAGKLAADSVSTTNLIAGSVQATQIAAGAVLADKIAANAVTAEKINALAVTADKVAANAINAGHITAGAVTAAKLAATLVLGSTIIAGTSTTGARVQLNSNGIEAYRSNGMKVLDFDVTSGDMTIAGRYRSQDSGTRVEINPGGTAPDEIRFYQGSVYGFIGAESGAGGTAAVVMRASPSGRGQVGVYGAEAYTGWFSGSETTARSAAAAQANRLNLFGGDIFISTRKAYGNGIVEFTEDGRLDSLLQYRRRSDGGGPLLMHPGESGLIFASNAIGVLGANDTTNGPIVATQYLPPSSETLKDGIAEIVIPEGRTSWDLIEGAPSMDWYYTSETGDRRRKHRFPIAEDLAALDPDLVAKGVFGGPDDYVVDLRDVVGILWDFADKMIKRQRLLETRLQTRVPLLNMPNRPQRGDLAEGIGAIIAGRTRRVLDPLTGLPARLK